MNFKNVSIRHLAVICKLVARGLAVTLGVMISLAGIQTQTAAARVSHTAPAEASDPGRSVSPPERRIAENGGTLFRRFPGPGPRPPMGTRSCGMAVSTTKVRSGRSRSRVYTPQPTARFPMFLAISSRFRPKPAKATGISTSNI